MKTHLNLLPWRFRRRMIIRARCREWAVGLIVACCVPALWCYAIIEQTEDLQAELKAAELLAGPIRERLLQNENLSEEMRRAGRREELVSELRASRSPLQFLGLLSEHARRAGGAVQIRGLQFVTEAGATSVLPAREDSGTHDAGSRLRVGVQGVAIDDQAVSQFMQSLHTSGVFAGLDLRQTGDREIGQARVREFSLECSFPVEATRVADRARVTR